jgi:hypothetical protein
MSHVERKHVFLTSRNRVAEQNQMLGLLDKLYLSYIFQTKWLPHFPNQTVATSQLSVSVSSIQNSTSLSKIFYMENALHIL